MRTDFGKQREDIVNVVVEASNLATEIVNDMERHYLRAERYKSYLVATLISMGLSQAAVGKVVEDLEAEVAGTQT